MFCRNGNYHLIHVYQRKIVWLPTVRPYDSLQNIPNYWVGSLASLYSYLSVLVSSSGPPSFCLHRGCLRVGDLGVAQGFGQFSSPPPIPYISPLGPFLNFSSHLSNVCVILYHNTWDILNVAASHVILASVGTYTTM